MIINGELTITDTGFLKLPAGTSAQRPSNPEVGMIRYNTSLGYIEYWNGSSWKRFEL